LLGLVGCVEGVRHEYACGDEIVVVGDF